MTMLRALLALLLIPALAGCPEGGDDDDSAAADDDDIPAEVEATLVLAHALDEPVEGLEITLDGDTVATDANGRARFTIPSQTDFEAEASGAEIQTTWFEGNSGVRDFQFTTFVGPVELHDAVVDGLGLPARDPAKGTLVVAMDTSALQPAMGASVTLSGSSDEPFVFVDDQPTLGNEIVFQAAGFVTFGNVDPGAVTVIVEPPDGQICLSFPGLSATANYVEYTVHAGAVTTAQYICQ